MTVNRKNLFHSHPNYQHLTILLGGVRLLREVFGWIGLNSAIVWEGGWVFALRTINTELSILTTILLSRVLGAG